VNQDSVRRSSIGNPQRVSVIMQWRSAAAALVATAAFAAVEPARADLVTVGAIPGSGINAVVSSGTATGESSPCPIVAPAPTRLPEANRCCQDRRTTPVSLH